jgi:hypothetical protein
VTCHTRAIISRLTSPPLYFFSRAYVSGYTREHSIPGWSYVHVPECTPSPLPPIYLFVTCCCFSRHVTISLAMYVDAEQGFSDFCTFLDIRNRRFPLFQSGRFFFLSFVELTYDVNSIRCRHYSCPVERMYILPTLTLLLTTPVIFFSFLSFSSWPTL